MVRLLSLFLSLLLVSGMCVAQVDEIAMSEDMGESLVTSLPEGTVIVATVNIYNAEIVSKEDNTLQIAFEIHNRAGSQSDISYGVLLMDEEGRIVHHQSYPETLSIQEGVLIPVTIEYIAPSLDGIYEVMLIAENSAGLRLGILSAGGIILDSREELLEFSCDYAPMEVDLDAPPSQHPHTPMQHKQSDRICTNCCA
jgi:hypothetical protein